MTVNIDEMSVIERIEMELGLKPKQEFIVKPTEIAKIIECKESDMIYSFRSDQLLYKGYDDGLSEWYGRNEKMVQRILSGLYEVIPLNKEK